LNKYQSSKSNKAIQQRTFSPSPSLKLKGLAQANVLAQASPLRLGEVFKKEAEAHVGSRLGKTPLAWAGCSLAQKAELVAWATFRTKVLGESPFISPRRDWLAWARLTGLATVLL